MKIKNITIAIFFAVIVLFPVVTLMLPRQTFSEAENRDLQKAPQFTWDSIKSKRFMTDSEKFLSDHIVFREGFVKAKTLMEMAIGKTEVNGVFITDKMLLEDLKIKDESISDKNIEFINEFAKKYDGMLKTYLTLIPSSTEVNRELLPAFATSFSQAEYIKNTYNKLGISTPIDVCTALNSNAKDYIYYRTDHHWTSYGAFVGYGALASQLGYKAATPEMFNIEHASYNFLGTLYSKVLYRKDLVDSIDLYHFSQSNVINDVKLYNGKNEITYPSIFFKENLESKDKYTVFLGQNIPVVKINTKVHNGRKLLLFKDSYSHTLMQFLPLHYEEIALVDLRYLNTPLEEYVNIYEYDQAMFIYSLSNFVQDSSLRKLTLY